MPLKWKITSRARFILRIKQNYSGFDMCKGYGSGLIARGCRYSGHISDYTIRMRRT
ncbi:unnamed protein product [Amoebophrya sp. A25]|nr:unnamed protein product [Amoebophrya sp. A25]|eukprot:GSA25T00006651001.1